MTDPSPRLTEALAERYRLEQELGQGGMATVYLAQDLRHDRQVAVKVLRPELAAVIGADRFLSEIKTTANLQHPHILPLFDSGEADGFLFYVMPFVEGESLRDRLQREKQLPVEEAVRIAREVASALDYAHRHDVVHRDIKPENILLHDGQALVADFGIALAASKAGGTRMTETGMSLGTPHYMSPEQAMGEREITARSDVYALGCVLYEILTGDPPFTGSTAQAIVARVVTESPRSLTAQRHTIPPHVEAAVLTALEKLPADRFPSAATFAEALANPGYTPSVTRTTARAPSVLRARPPLAVAGWAVAVVALGAALWGWLRPGPESEITRFSMLLPESQRLSGNHDGTSVAVSPDGRRLVYTGPDRALYVRALDQLQARPLPGTDGARAPFFSPDGEWVGFYSEASLKKVALSGGPPLTITGVGSDFRGAAWGPGDVIVYSPGTGTPLFRVSAAGGDTVRLTTLDTAVGSAEQSHRWPAFLPDGKGVLFTSFAGTMDESRLAVLSLESGEVQRLPLRGLRPQYATTGHLVYGAADASLVAVSFDADRLEVTGAPVSLLEGVMTRTSVVTDYALSRAGTLVYLSGRAPELALVLVNRRGEEEVLLENLQDPESPRFSPDGRRIALSRVEGGKTDVWIYSVDVRTMTRMTFEGNNRYPTWTPDGARIAYSHAPERTPGRSLYWLRADGSGTPEPLYEAEGQQWEVAWLPDARSFVERHAALTGTGRDIWLVSRDSAVPPLPLLQTRFNERSPAVSPDGRWLAYASDESGRDEVYVRPIPGPGGKRQVSIDGGTEPLWTLDGRNLLYRGPDASVYTVAIGTAPVLSVGQRRVLLPNRYATNPQHTNYDLSPRTGQFVFFKGSELPTELVVVMHWNEELKARVKPAR